MISTITLNNKLATKINAVKIRETQYSILFDCEGDREWLSKKFIKYDDKTKTVIIEDWLYKERFEE